MFVYNTDIRFQTQRIQTEMNGTIAFSILSSQMVFDMLAQMCLAWVNSEAKHQGGILVTITSVEMFIS